MPILAMKKQSKILLVDFRGKVGCNEYNFLYASVYKMALPFYLKKRSKENPCAAQYLSMVMANSIKY